MYVHMFFTYYVHILIICFSHTTYILTDIDSKMVSCRPRFFEVYGHLFGALRRWLYLAITTCQTVPCCSVPCCIPVLILWLFYRVGGGKSMKTPNYSKFIDIEKYDKNIQKLSKRFKNYDQKF